MSEVAPSRVSLMLTEPEPTRFDRPMRLYGGGGGWYTAGSRATRHVSDCGAQLAHNVYDNLKLYTKKALKRLLL